MNRFSLAVLIWGTLANSAIAARLNLGMSNAVFPGIPDSQVLRLDVLWTMQATDTASTRLTALDLRFNVAYPVGHPNTLRVLGISALPDWETSASEGIGDPFSEDFFLGVGDGPGIAGIQGNGTEFAALAASVFLRIEGNATGTEITFRHNGPGDPLPAPHDGPRDWQLRWQYEVTGPLQFDIGVGNPGDGGGTWTYHGYETYQPLVIVPEPGPLAVLLLSALAMFRFRR